MITLDTAVKPCKVLYMKADKITRDQANARKSLVTHGAALDAALEEVSRCKDRLGQVVRASHVLGLTEVEIARLAGISRPTVRDWLGKT